MAAAEYFSNAPMTQSSYQPPPSHPQQATYSPNPAPHSSYIQTPGAPPPYQEQRPGFHSAPIPIEPPQRHSFSGQQRPSFSSPPNSWSQPPQAYSQQLSPSNMPMQSRPPQSYGTSPANGYGAQPQTQQYLSPHVQPSANPNASQFSLENDEYTSDPESHRRKHKHKSRRDGGESRSGKPNSRSKNADAFLGAAGGGLIGDLIFPGLGTVGGAALGWLGGRDYGNHRKEREEKRHREQREWDDKFRPQHHHHHHHHHNRSRSRDRRSRGSSTDIGEIDHRDSHGRRHGHH